MKTEQRMLESTSNNSVVVPFVMLIRTILISNLDCFDGERNALLSCRRNNFWEADVIATKSLFLSPKRRGISFPGNFSFTSHWTFYLSFQTYTSSKHNTFQVLHTKLDINKKNRPYVLQLRKSRFIRCSDFRQLTCKY